MQLLNKITEERMRAAVVRDSGWLEELVASPAMSARDDQNAGELGLNLGFYCHVLEPASTRARDYFSAAAAHCALALAKRAAPQASEYRNVYSAELFLCAIAVFGSEQDRQRCAPLTRSQLTSPEDPAVDATAGYLGVVARHLGGAPLDTATLDDLAQQCDKVQASRIDRRFVLPSVQGLLAIARRDEPAFNQAIAQLVAAHTEEALKGEFKLLAQGLICMRAMMLAQFGRDAGLACSIASPYLPQQLLRQE